MSTKQQVGNTVDSSYAVVSLEGEGRASDDKVNNQLVSDKQQIARCGARIKYSR